MRVRYSSLAIPVVCCIANVAFAQEPGVVELVTVAQSHEGVLPVQLLALDTTGQPLLGIKGKVTTSEGVVADWVEVGNGVYAGTLRCTIGGDDREITLKFKGKTADKKPIEVERKIAIRSDNWLKLEFTSSRPAIVLGQDVDSTLRITVKDEAGQPVDNADLVMVASSGEVTNVTSMGSGTYTARYVAPRVNYPHLAILSVVDRAHPERGYGQLTLPLVGKTDYPVQAAPQSSVLLQVAGQEFGPVVAGADGRAVGPVLVPPGVNSATLVTVTGGVSKSEPMDLKVPETRRLAFLPGPTKIPSDSRLAVPYRFVVRTPTGEPDAVTKVNVLASAGVVSSPESLGNGVFQVLYTPPMSASATTVTLKVSVEGSSVQNDSKEVSLVPALPSALTLKADPDTLTADAEAVKVFAHLSGADEKGFADGSFSWATAGGTVKGDVTDLRGGDYRADLSATKGQSLSVSAAVQGASASGGVVDVLLYSSADSAAPGETVLLTVVTVDAWGSPVGNVPVQLLVDGDGTLGTSALNTNAFGIGQAAYVAGATPDVAVITAANGNFTSSAAVLQASRAKVDFGELRVAPAFRDWAKRVASVHVAREGATVATAAEAAPVPVNPAPNSGLTVRSEPASVPAGGTLQLKVRLTDGEGRGIAGETLELLTSSGVFGPVADLGGGDYSIPLTVPETATAEVKVSVATSKGQSAFIKVPVSAGTPAAVVGWGTLEPTTTPPVTETPAVTGGIGTLTSEGPKPVAVAKDAPDFRLGLGYSYGSYHYTQSSEVSDGPLLPVVFEVGGDAGPNANAHGIVVDSRFFPDRLKYLGFDGRVRVGWYAIGTDLFQGETVSDQLVDARVAVIGRYPFKVGAANMHVGARAGFEYSDFLLFRGCLEDGCTIEYDTLALPGYSVGAEYAVDVGRWFAEAGFNEGFYMASPYMSALDVKVGAHIISGLYADVGFGYTNRHISVLGAVSGDVYGEVRDEQVGVSAGLGFAF